MYTFNVVVLDNNHYMAIQSTDFLIGEYADLISPPMMLPAPGDEIQVL